MSVRPTGAAVVMIDRAPYNARREIVCGSYEDRVSKMWVTLSMDRDHENGHGATLHVRRVQSSSYEDQADGDYARGRRGIGEVTKTGFVPVVYVNHDLLVENREFGGSARAFGRHGTFVFGVRCQ